MIQVQMVAKRCCNIITGEHNMPAMYELNHGNARAAQAENRKIPCDYTSNVGAHEQMIGTPMTIIQSAVLPAAGSVLKGMHDPIKILTSLPKRVSWQGNPAL
jgi:hypothetical protein